MWALATAAATTNLTDTTTADGALVTTSVREEVSIIEMITVAITGAIIVTDGVPHTARHRPVDRRRLCRGVAEAVSTSEGRSRLLV